MPCSTHRWQKQYMRTTIDFNEDLLALASKLAGLQDRSALVHEALKAFVERESARQLARLGGTQPNLTAERPRQVDRIE